MASEPHPVPRPSHGVQVTMEQMTMHLQTIIGAAERAAEAIRHDAEEQARVHLAEAQRKANLMTADRVRLISSLTDELIRDAGDVHGRSREMLASIDEAIGSLAAKLQPGAAAEPAATALPGPGQRPDRPGQQEDPGGASQEALIHATRLAVGGRGREQIAAELRERFGIADPAPIVERVLGPPESAPGS